MFSEAWKRNKNFDNALAELDGLVNEVEQFVNRIKQPLNATDLIRLKQDIRSTIAIAQTKLEDVRLLNNEFPNYKMASRITELEDRATKLSEIEQRLNDDVPKPDIYAWLAGTDSPRRRGAVKR